MRHTAGSSTHTNGASLTRRRLTRVAARGRGVFCLLNGRDLTYTVDEAETLMLTAAAGDLDVPDIATWLRHHLEDAS